ncbi:uncharacterized protein MYCGRDRAFT_111762 [Zymoseptoria tritici IPO323]|uniref:Uncharacterized protein n=1 Tax=Zymoseptoria tritici (strain CBS 115943 / IPO323) TaxID=336722 RepID=F9XRD7_ZYMTI|nr:uncharacterized protein MYCGRDRAFT_111762 [Zymoseptoria tritici IPO323]EGP82186.1 hypothetical protein MYCGRDRAFT_111762 [Zymoseptoria tritici IPO323]
MPDSLFYTSHLSDYPSPDDSSPNTTTSRRRRYQSRCKRNGEEEDEKEAATTSSSPPPQQKQAMARRGRRRTRSEKRGRATIPNDGVDISHAHLPSPSPSFSSRSSSTSSSDARVLARHQHGWNLQEWNALQVGLRGLHGEVRECIKGEDDKMEDDGAWRERLDQVRGRMEVLEGKLGFDNNSAACLDHSSRRVGMRHVFGLAMVLGAVLAMVGLGISWYDQGAMTGSAPLPPPTCRLPAVAPFPALNLAGVISGGLSTDEVKRLRGSGALWEVLERAMGQAEGYVEGFHREVEVMVGGGEERAVGVEIQEESIRVTMSTTEAREPVCWVKMVGVEGEFERLSRGLRVLGEVVAALRWREEVLREKEVLRVEEEESMSMVSNEEESMSFSRRVGIVLDSISSKLRDAASRAELGGREWVKEAKPEAGED